MQCIAPCASAMTWLYSAGKCFDFAKRVCLEGEGWRRNEARPRDLQWPEGSAGALDLHPRNTTEGVRGMSQGWWVSSCLLSQRSKASTATLGSTWIPLQMGKDKEQRLVNQQVLGRRCFKPHLSWHPAATSLKYFLLIPGMFILRNGPDLGLVHVMHCYGSNLQCNPAVSTQDIPYRAPPWQIPPWMGFPRRRGWSQAQFWIIKS